MKRLQVLVCCFYLDWICYGQPGNSLQSTVSVKMVDSYGHDVPFRVSEFTETNGTKNLASHFNTNARAVVPFGMYKYTLTPQNEEKWHPVHGSANIYNVKVLLVDQSFTRHPDRIIDTRGYSVQGKIHSGKRIALNSLWVRFVSPYSTQDSINLNAEVSKDGLFVVTTPEPGNYVIIVCRTGEILATRSMTVPLRDSAVDIYIN